VLIKPYNDWFVSQGVAVMKKIVVSVFLCVMAEKLWALDIPLADTHFQQCVLATAQQKNWQAITDVTEIQCHSQSIKSIAGIEHFTQLQKLSLYNNELESVSLSGLPKLRHVNIAKNKLTQVAFSDLPELEELYIFGNKLTALELQKLPRLSLIKINDNQLKKFTYADLPELEKIYMFNNHIEDVDIYHLPNMHYMDARQNPMPDKLYEEMDLLKGVTFLHDGNAEDWQ